MTTAILTPEDIQQRLREAQQAPAAVEVGPTPAPAGAGTAADGLPANPEFDVDPDETTPPSREFKFYRPLADAADEYIGWARTPGQRLYLGIPEFDAAMRGTAPGEMTVVVGYAHSGKTVLTTQLIFNNKDRRLIMFSPDETRVLILVKLTSLVTGMSAEELEERIAHGDHDAEQLVRRTAIEHFPNLAVFDDSLSLDQMTTAVNETEEAWGAPAEGVIFDYLDLLPFDTDVPAKFNALKAWGKRMRCPLWVLHQSSRTSGADGAEQTISSGGYGGEQQATHLIGVRRKKHEAKARIREIEKKLRTQQNPSPALHDALAEARYDLETHQSTVTFNLVKNKRPPSHLVDDMDFTLDSQTGAVRPFNLREAGRSSARGEAFQRRTDGSEEPF